MTTQNHHILTKIWTIIIPNLLHYVFNDIISSGAFICFRFTDLLHE